MQQLEARHRSRAETTRDQLVRNDQSSPEQSAMARSRRWPMLHRERWALKMKDDKTESLIIRTRSKLGQVIPNLAPMSISGCDIPFSQSVRNLGFYLDETLSMDAHIKYLCRILFCQLRRIGKKSAPSCQLMLPTNFAVSLILSMLDYCNFLLAGLPDNKLNKLQRIQNHAARHVLRESKHASATALLRTLHWLPVKARIHYKIACLCFSVYLSEQYATLYF